MNSKVKKKNAKFRYTKGKFAVIKFYESENKIKLFDCIPDLWFADEEKNHCYWPPKSKKSVTLRAMNQDLPEDDWSVYECEVISEGHGKIKNVHFIYPVFRIIFFPLQLRTVSVLTL